MPHHCTECEEEFEDGSKRMLSGCPGCGGNTFQFQPAADSQANGPATAPTQRADGASTRAAGRAEPTEDQPDPRAPWPTDEIDDPGNAPDSDIIDADGQRSMREPPAQSTARGEVADVDGGAADPTVSGGGDDSANPRARDERSAGAASPDSSIREQLEEQFESIRIVEPGEYELNLMELYNREEYILSLQGDGRYVIQVPDRWADAHEAKDR